MKWSLFFTFLYASIVAHLSVVASYCDEENPETCIPCPPKFYRRPGRPLCYRVVGVLEGERIERFWEARQHCEMMEGHLVSILDKATSDFIAKLLQDHYGFLIPKQSFWIGLSDDVEEGIYRWENPQDGIHKVGDFEQWGEYQPDDGGVLLSQRYMRSPIKENCIVWQFTYSPHWKDVMCDLKRRYICQVYLPELKETEATRTETPEIQAPITESNCTQCPLVENDERPQVEYLPNEPDENVETNIESPKPLPQVESSSSSSNTNIYVVVGVGLFLIILLTVGGFALKRMHGNQRVRQIGVLKQTGLYPNMSSYRQNRFNISNNNRTIPAALLPPIKLFYLPLGSDQQEIEMISDRSSTSSGDRRKLHIETFD